MSGCTAASIKLACHSLQSGWSDLFACSVTTASQDCFTDNPATSGLLAYVSWWAQGPLVDVWINMPSVTVTACSVGLEHFNIVKIFHSSTRYIATAAEG